jgi:hypothetical protein
METGVTEMPAYRTWKEWNAVHIKLLKKLDREQRAIDSLWKPEDAHKRELAQLRLAKVLEQIEAHEKDYVTSPATYNFLRSK